MRKIIHFAIHQPLFVCLLTGLFIGTGVIAFRNLPIEAFPDVTDIQVTVVTLFPGHAAEEVEKQVTIPVEIAVSGLPHSVRVFSTRNSVSPPLTSPSTTPSTTTSPASRSSNAFNPWTCPPVFIRY